MDNQNATATSLLPYCNTRWDSWTAVLRRYLLLKQAINLFTSMADDSEHVPKVPHGKPLYAHYKLCDAEWMLVQQIHSVLEVRNVYLSRLHL
jgi:hypothetical protein